MDTIVVKETAAGWIVWDADYEEVLSIPYLDKCSAEADLDNVKSNRAEQAYENFLDHFYG